MPWKAFYDKFRQTRGLTAKQADAELSKLNRRGKAVEFFDVFKSRKELDFIKVADKTYKGLVAYLPKREVERDDALSKKCRPVFDGSERLKGQPSINDLLEVGPNLNPEILEVLLRFRLHKVAWTADITKAFLQIRLAEKDQEKLRFLFPLDPLKPELDYEEYS